MLIVEGTDCIGKTTLCNALIKRLELKGKAMTLQHFGYLPDTWHFYRDYLKYINNTTVMDRFIMSEVAYGDTLRGYSRIEPEVYRLLDAHLRLDNSVTVVIFAEYNWLKNWLDAKYDAKREMYDKEKILKVNDTFTKIVRQHVSAFTCDFDIAYCIDDFHPMPSNDDKFIEHVVNTYLTRQAIREIKLQEATHGI